MIELPPRVRAWIVAAAIGVQASVAVAQVAQVAHPGQTAPTTGAEARYLQGSMLFSQHRFVEAALAFEDAYAVSQAPELLFNIARAWEEAGDVRRALDAYERFESRGSTPANIAEIRERIDRLRASVAAARRAAEAARSTPAPVAVEAPPPRRYVGPIVVASAGGALVAAALPLWVAAQAARDGVVAGCTGNVCPESLRADADRARTLAVAGDVMMGVGAASLGAALTWWLVARSQASPVGPRVAVIPASGGCAVVGTF